MEQVFLLSTGIFGSMGITLNLVVCPSLSKTNDPLPVFRTIYKNGKRMALSTVIVTSISGMGCYLKSNGSTGKRDWRYLAAIGLSLAVIPYTAGFMMQVNNALFDMESKKDEESKIQQLLDKWSHLQWGRTFLGVAAFAFALSITRNRR